MFYSAPSPYSFIPAQSVFGTALAVICWSFLGVSAMALLVKWAYWNNYSSTIMKRPLIVRVSRYLSYLDAAACALLVLDRFILKLAYRSSSRPLQDPFHAGAGASWSTRPRRPM